MYKIVYGIKNREKCITIRKNKDDISSRELVRQLVGHPGLNFNWEPLRKEGDIKTVTVSIPYTNEELEVVPVVLFDGLVLRDKRVVKREITQLVDTIKRWLLEYDSQEVIIFK